MLEGESIYYVRIWTTPSLRTERLKELEHHQTQASKRRSAASLASYIGFTKKAKITEVPEQTSSSKPIQITESETAEGKTELQLVPSPPPVSTPSLPSSSTTEHLSQPSSYFVEETDEHWPKGNKDGKTWCPKCTSIGSKQCSEKMCLQCCIKYAVWCGCTRHAEVRNKKTRKPILDKITSAINVTNQTLWIQYNGETENAGNVRPVVPLSWVDKNQCVKFIGFCEKEKKQKNYFIGRCVRIETQPF
eukprot:TRINITY_DN2983_c0_g1_i2.p2 TRINITY_DN2983_c0_g1~~TRINITY_DN2983_c0_g1_i2.p2  ORF type:complete len:247 (-),score=53.17 TRINITY_DN2983_c0_g1_i2:40-780(-)